MQKILTNSNRRSGSVPELLTGKKDANAQLPRNPIGIQNFLNGTSAATAEEQSVKLRTCLQFSVCAFLFFFFLDVFRLGEIANVDLCALVQ